MGFLNGAFLIVLGALCIPGAIAKRSPNAKELLDKVVPFQGIIGFVSFLWGVWTLISALLNLGWITYFPVRFITWVAVACILVCGGALLGWGMIQKHLLKNAPDNVKASAEKSFERLLAFQPKIGFVAILLGVWAIVSTILF